MSSAEIFTTAYPRSGNTWLVRLLSDLLNASQQDIPSEPLINTFAEKIEPNYIIRKTHWYEWQYPNIGYAGEPCKIIWISRDIRDMAVSIMHYRSLTSDQLQNTIISLDNPGLPDVGIHAFVNGWTENPPDFHVTYESLHNDPITVLKELHLEIAGESVSDERIERVIERQQFGRWNQTFPHSMRKGIVGDWRNFFHYDDAILFEKLYGDILRFLGYTEDSSWMCGLDD